MGRKAKMKRILAFAVLPALCFGVLSAGVPYRSLAAEAEPQWISQSDMTVTAGSYQAGNEPEKAADGNASTIWHTSWSDWKELPQSITLTLSRPADGVYQLRYTPRTDKDWNGTILSYRVSVSEDGETFTDVAAGVWDADKTEKTATFDARDGVRAVRLTGCTTKGNSESEDSRYVSAAELNLVCRKGFIRDKSGLAKLTEQGRALAEKTDGGLLLLRETLSQAEEALADPFAVQERYDALARELQEIVKTKTAFTGYQGSRMYDTAGERIQAHGGQITKWGDTYYWYGEDKSEGFRPIGVHLYTSKDLYNWEDHGLVLKTMRGIEEIDTEDYFRELYGSLDAAQRQEVFRHLDYNTAVVERPKVLYNETTGKYVMWFHADGPEGEGTSSYAKAMAGVAVADRPEGPFRFLQASRLHCSEDYTGENKGMARDMNVFQDADGTAYILYASEENASLYISRLRADYTDLDVREGAVEGKDFTRNMAGSSREAPAMFQFMGKYYLMTSGCTGWDPNEAIYYTADTPLGPWTEQGNPCAGAEKETTFRTQSTCIFPVDAAQGKFIYMGDRWNRSDLADSRYVWLPVEIGYDGEMKIEGVSDWKKEEIKAAAAAWLYQNDMIYFVDCNQAESKAWQTFARRGIVLKNQTADQRYDGTWGMAGKAGTYNGTELFGSGYWARKNTPIVYRFTLPKGSYRVYGGVREWWTEERLAQCNVNYVEYPDTAQERTSPLAEAVTVHTTAADKHMVFETAFTLEQAGIVEISLEKESGGDPLLSWLGIAGTMEQEPAKKPDDGSGQEENGKTDDKQPLPQKGSIQEKGILRYKVTKSDAVNGTVTVVKLLKGKKTVKIPASVVLNGYSFRVSAVSAKAFQKQKKLKKVVIGAQVKRIGKRSFYGCKNLRNVVFKGKTAPKLGKQAFAGIHKKCKVSVPKAMKKKQAERLKRQIAGKR